MIRTRTLVSFDDLCPYQCKHCYTLDIPRDSRNRTAAEIVQGLAGQKFDVVYVSQRRENFCDPMQGLALCESLFEEYGKDLFLITRNVFDEEAIGRLARLRDLMRSRGRSLAAAVSIFAMESYGVSENPYAVPSPQERIAGLKRLSQAGIHTMLLLRPVFPGHIVPVSELLRVIDECREHVQCVVSSGLAVNEPILWRLGLDPQALRYAEGAEYLDGAMEGSFKFLDVRRELEAVREHCLSAGIPFFSHSMPALNQIFGYETEGILPNAV